MRAAAASIMLSVAAYALTFAKIGEPVSGGAAVGLRPQHQLPRPRYGDRRLSRAEPRVPGRHQPQPRRRRERRRFPQRRKLPLRLHRAQPGALLRRSAPTRWGCATPPARASKATTSAAAGRSSSGPTARSGRHDRVARRAARPMSASIATRAHAIVENARNATHAAVARPPQASCRPPRRRHGGAIAFRRDRLPWRWSSHGLRSISGPTSSPPGCRCGWSTCSTRSPISAAPAGSWCRPAH